MIQVNLKKVVDDTYSIDIGKGNSPKLPSLLKKLVPAFRYIIITDSNVAKLYGKTFLFHFEKEKLNASLVSFRAGEENKTRETKAELENKILQHSAGKDSVIIALGGGVVGDVAGFVASTLFRGIPFVQVPTTLLAQVDSSNGGKTAVDHPLGKNLIGAYHQPKHICIDTDFLKTLSQEEYVNGIAEIIKQALIQDEKFFLFLEKEMEKLVNRDEKILKTTIEWNCKLKASIIEKDEREIGPRKILNFGHTIGHAIETLSQYKLRHGYAVSVGMVAESLIAKELGWLKENDVQRIENILKRVKLPTRLPKSISPITILKKMQLDKKSKEGKIKYSLIDKVGHCEFNVGVENEIALRCMRGIME
ncbi:MAG: 3-dehydroquinate synthase [Ignavibacteriales bacterium]|nr:3-dehydroquinate synthase [Ignavibacteriales bacterium]